MLLHECVKDVADQYFANLYDDPENVYPLFLAQFEKPLLQSVLEHTHGNQCRAAKILGLSRTTLRTKMKSYELL